MNLMKNKRLYLSKDENIFINFNFSQNQVDSIRFLYKQFKKKKPFVILNDSSEQDLILEVVLFLGCIKRFLDKPVLVLSDEADSGIFKWTDTFTKWTDNASDIESSTPCMSKKKFHISPDTNSMASLKHWSILVIHGLNPTKDHLNMKAEYKIWITTEPLKENLSELFNIYSRVYPKEKLNINDFIPNKNKPKDVVEKAIMLDILFEDVLWSSHFVADNKKLEDKLEVKLIKNKDVTGTKIKRTKRKLEDINGSDVLISKNNNSVKNRDNIGGKKTKSGNFIESDESDFDNEIKMNLESEMDSTVRTTKFKRFICDSDTETYEKDSQNLDDVKSIRVSNENHSSNDFDKITKKEIKTDIVTKTKKVKRFIFDSDSEIYENDNSLSISNINHSLKGPDDTKGPYNTSKNLIDNKEKNINSPNILECNSESPLLMDIIEDNYKHKENLNDSQNLLDWDSPTILGISDSNQNSPSVMQSIKEDSNDYVLKYDNESENNDSQILIKEQNGTRASDELKSPMKKLKPSPDIFDSGLE